MELLNCGFINEHHPNLRLRVHVHGLEHKTGKALQHFFVSLDAGLVIDLYAHDVPSSCRRRSS